MGLIHNSVAAPPRPVGPVASKWVRFAARAIDAVAEFVLVVVCWYAVGDIHKLVTDLFLAAMVITAYETLSYLWAGGTPGMRLLGVRVVELDSSGRPSGAACLRRGAMVAVLTVLPFVGWGLWLASMLGDALGRAGGEGEPAGRGGVAHQPFEAGLEDRHFAAPEAFHLVRINVDAQHLMAGIGKDRRLHQPDIAAAEDRRSPRGADAGASRSGRNSRDPRPLLEGRRRAPTLRRGRPPTCGPDRGRSRTDLAIGGEDDPQGRPADDGRQP